VASDFLPWAIGGAANVESQPVYAIDPFLLNGPGSNVIVPVVMLNKNLRQATFVAAAIAAFVADDLLAAVVDGGSVSTFEGQLRSAIRYSAGVQSLSISASAFDHYSGVNLHGAASGAVALLASSGTYNWNLPTTAGARWGVLLSGGGGGSPMTWGPTTGVGPGIACVNAPTFSGAPVIPRQRTGGPYAVNGGGVLTNGVFYTCIPAASVPVGLTAVFASNSSANDSSVLFILVDGAGTQLVTLVTGGSGGTSNSFQFDGSGNLQVRHNGGGGGSAVITTYWTVITR